MSTDGAVELLIDTAERALYAKQRALALRGLPLAGALPLAVENGKGTVTELRDPARTHNSQVVGCPSYSSITCARGCMVAQLADPHAAALSATAPS
jgi:hypothetical protein